MLKDKKFWWGVLAGALLFFGAVVVFRGGWNFNPFAKTIPPTV